MTTKRIIDVNTAARADGKVPAWDTATATHLYVSPSSVAATTAPTFVAAGTSATGTGAIVPGLPAGHTTNDILLLFVQSDNQAATAPAGYAQLGSQPALGTAATASATRLAIFWKRDSGADSDPTVADTGDHTLAQIIAIRGCPTTGDPFVSVGQTRKATASTTGTGSAGATTVDNCLIVQAFAHSLDSATAVFSSWTNASLASITERVDVATADGNGGGIGVATGVLVTAGPFVATTVTETSTNDVGSTFYMVPADAVNVARASHIDTQVYLAPGTDTWTKPSGAKVVQITCIAGASSGSAGRNAATAAGGGGGGGGGWAQAQFSAGDLPATLTIDVGAGGAATANTDGAASNAGTSSDAKAGAVIIAYAGPGAIAGASSSGSGGTGGQGGGFGTTATATESFGSQQASGGAGGTTAAAGVAARDFAGGGGAGGGTSQAASAGGAATRGGGGGGGGRSNTNVGTGGGGGPWGQLAGGATASANGADSPYLGYGGSGGAGGTSASGPGGTGGFPGGGGGGGGSQSGAQRGGAGADGIVTVITYF